MICPTSFIFNSIVSTAKGAVQEEAVKAFEAGERELA